MRDQLRLVEELSLVDAKIHEAEAQLLALPAKLKSIKDAVATVEVMLQAERKQLDETLRYKATLDAELRAEQDTLQKAKIKLQAVRNTKEYLAVQREFDANKKTASERDLETAKLTDAIAQFEKSIAQHEEELKAMQQHVAEEEELTTSRLQEVEAEIGRHTAERDTMVGAIRRDVMVKYESIRKRKPGRAVVPVVNGVCTGCNMSVRPQVLIHLHRGESIELCPSCQRIIFLEKPAEQ